MENAVISAYHPDPDVVKTPKLSQTFLGPIKSNILDQYINPEVYLKL